MEKVTTETVSATSTANPKRLTAKASMETLRTRCREPVSSYFHFAAKNWGISSDVGVKLRSLE